MGPEAACMVGWGRKVSAGRALLESAALIFRGGFRLAIPFKQVMTAAARDGTRVVRFAGGTASFPLGPKGQPRLREDDVRGAATEAGLVDVKVVSSSPTLSALKLVVPVAKR